MNAKANQSTLPGHFPPKTNANKRVEKVPAKSEARRFTSPAKVEVLPSNINKNTEKKAANPKGRPAMAASSQAGFGDEKVS